MSRAQGRLVGNGHVTIYEPTDRRPCYRLDYYDETGRRRQASAGRSPAAALKRAEDIDDQLSRFRGGDDTRTLGDLMTEYLSTPVRRHRSVHGRLDGRDWAPGQYTSVKRDLRRAVRGFEDLPAWRVDRSVIDDMRTACGTPNQVEQMTGRVRCFLRWCEEQGAMTPEQVALLPAMLAPAKRPRFPQPEPRPARPRLAPMHDRAEEFIDEEDCPSHNEVLALAAALALAVPKWGELAVHTAVGLGLRAGEQFQLRADDLRPDGKGGFHLHVDWQWSAGHTRRTRPKHGRRRRVPVARMNRNGYPLLEMLLIRAEQARAEQADGRNPQALLFPAHEGGGSGGRQRCPLT